MEINNLPLNHSLLERERIYMESTYNLSSYSEVPICIVILTWKIIVTKRCYTPSISKITAIIELFFYWWCFDRLYSLSYKRVRIKARFWSKENSVFPEEGTKVCHLELEVCRIQFLLVVWSVSPTWRGWCVDWKASVQIDKFFLSEGEVKLDSLHKLFFKHWKFE